MELNRFIQAHKSWIDIAISELKSGFKKSHWIWFIFPQLRGLGTSSMSYYFGLEGIEDAVQFCECKYLYKNLKSCLKILCRYKNVEDVKQCLGELDTMKLHSCVTLFYLATNKNIFKRILVKFFNSLIDQRTVILLERGN